MEDTLISFETAKLAKEKGFNISGINIYENKELLCEVEFKNWNNGTLCLLAPTQSLLSKWLREKFMIIPEVNAKWYNYKISGYSLKVKNTYYKEHYNTYEEALEIGLQKALKLIK